MRKRLLTVEKVKLNCESVWLGYNFYLCDKSFEKISTIFLIFIFSKWLDQSNRWIKFRCDLELLKESIARINGTNTGAAILNVPELRVNLMKIYLLFGFVYDCRRFNRVVLVILFQFNTPVKRISKHLWSNLRTRQFSVLFVFAFIQTGCDLWGTQNP